jgi:hypothetical protein
LDKVEARRILQAELARWQVLTWAQLKDRIGDIVVTETTGIGGAVYQIEIEPIWDDDPGGAIRVLGAIDDGRFWSAFSPITDDLLVNPDAV